MLSNGRGSNTRSSTAWADEQRQLNLLRNELLIRARDAGMTNIEIAEALNAGSRQPLDELLFEPSPRRELRR
jgi:hypothetical protein